MHATCSVKCQSLTKVILTLLVSQQLALHATSSSLTSLMTSTNQCPARQSQKLPHKIHTDSRCLAGWTDVIDGPLCTDIPLTVKTNEG